MRYVVLATLLVVVPAAAAAEWVRVPIGGSEAPGIPSTWDRLEQRAERAFTVSWSNPARFEPNYTWNSDASVGSMNLVTAGGITVEVTWLEFPTAAAAAEYAEMMLSSWGMDSYYQVRSEGAHVLTVYPYDYELATSIEVLDALQGR